MTYSIAVARLSDRQVVQAFSQIIDTLEIPNARIHATGTDNFVNGEAAPPAFFEHEVFKGVLEQESSALTHISMLGNGGQFLRLHRPDNTPTDTLTFNWQQAAQSSLSAQQFARLVALAKEKLNAFQAGSEASATGYGSFDDVARARFLELAELRSIAGQVTLKAQDHLQELDRRHAGRTRELEAQATEARKRIDAELEAERAKLNERAATLDARAADLDLSDNKAARRKLRENLRETLRQHSSRFELSSTTRRLRTPTAVLLVFVLGATGYLTYATFTDLASGLRAHLEWWEIALMSAKQVFFAATFLGFATYTIRWFESWSRRHADAEFHFKQLELDIDRASWVVEVALEWRQQQGAELPKELLAQLSANLFSEVDFAGGDHTEGIAAAMLGAAARLKLTTPTGELEINKGRFGRLRGK